MMKSVMHFIYSFTGLKNLGVKLFRTLLIYVAEAMRH